MVIINPNIMYVIFKKSALDLDISLLLVMKLYKINVK